jgi:hypothetical protein
MRVITPGHVYELQSFEPGDAQVLHFIEKKQKDDSTELVTVKNGTTNEEVLEMMIDRLRFLSGVVPSRETSLAISKLQEALFWLNERTRDRETRGVEGTRRI